MKRLTVIAVVAAVGLVACSGSPAPVAHPSASPSVSIDTTSPPMPTASPDSTIPVGPPGKLMVRTHAVGAKVVPVAAAIGAKTTLRFTCTGGGTVSITDHTGREILTTSGCSLGVIYTVSWMGKLHDVRTVRVGVSATTSWALDMWNGNPAVKLAGPATA